MIFMEYCKYDKLGNQRITVKEGITTLKRQASHMFRDLCKQQKIMMHLVLLFLQLL